MRTQFVKTLLELAKQDKNIHIVTGDLGFGVLQPFFDELPDQISNAGIAEQSMTGIAAGMALSGKTVFTYSIGNFPTLRCLEQIRNDCAYHNANVKIVCVGGGFVYGPLGMSHHATEDLAVMRALPNVAVFAPGDLVEAEAVTKAIVSYPGTCYLRLGRGGERVIHTEEIDFHVGQALQIQAGSEVAVFSTGAIFDEVVDAVKKLQEMKGIMPSVYTFPTVKPIDENTIVEVARSHRFIFTVEEHTVVGGLGSAVAEVIAGMNPSGVRAQVIRLGLNDTYSSIVGSQKYLRNYYGLSSDKIYQQISRML